MPASHPLPLDAALPSAEMFADDAIAGLGLTAFLALAQAAGCKTADGDQSVEAVQTITLGA